jgi:molybdopterin-guanine dinucleotide biosynthesis protein A
MSPMGSDKATLLFDAKPLWQIQLELLQKLEPAEIWRSRRCRKTPGCVCYITGKRIIFACE